MIAQTNYKRGYAMMTLRITGQNLLQGAALSIFAVFAFSVAMPAITLAEELAPATNHNEVVTASETKEALTDTAGLLSSSDQVATRTDADSALVASTGGTAVDAPKDPEQGVTFGANGGPQLEVELPSADEASTAKPVAPGVVAYDSGNGSANAVQATEDGSLRMLTVIDNPGAPTEYDYKVTVPSGGYVELGQDGGAVIMDNAAHVIATVATPWATDTTGKQVKTWFTTDGVTLSQVIEHDTDDVAYPVTADPKISFGWKIYVTLSKSETKYLAARPNQAGAYYALPGAAGCFFIGAGFLGFTCGGYITVRSASLMDALGKAASMNGCLEMGLPYGIYSPMLFWSSIYSISFKAVRC